jgi:hypothetical protein
MWKCIYLLVSRYNFFFCVSVQKQRLNYLHVSDCVLLLVVSFLGNERETNNETTSAGRQQVLNKQIYAAVTE